MPLVSHHKYLVNNYREISERQNNDFSGLNYTSTFFLWFLHHKNKSLLLTSREKKNLKPSFKKPTEPSIKMWNYLSFLYVDNERHAVNLICLMPIFNSNLVLLAMTIIRRYLWCKNRVKTVIWDDQPLYYLPDRLCIWNANQSPPYKIMRVILNWMRWWWRAGCIITNYWSQTRPVAGVKN